MKKTTIVLIAGGVLLAALGLIWRQLHPPLPKFNRAPSIGLGQTLADETVRAVNDRGRIVVVVATDPARPVLPGNGCWEGFRDELQKHAGIRIAATEFIPTEPTQGVIAGQPQVWSTCPSAVFKELWGRHADADALVFFIGLPSWNRVSGAITERVTPKILVVHCEQMPRQSDYRGYFTSGILSGLIGPALGKLPAASPRHPQTPREWFDQQYQVYSPQNFDTLPE